MRTLSGAPGAPKHSCGKMPGRWHSGTEDLGRGSSRQQICPGQLTRKQPSTQEAQAVRQHRQCTCDPDQPGHTRAPHHATRRCQKQSHLILETERGPDAGPSTAPWYSLWPRASASAATRRWVRRFLEPCMSALHVEHTSSRGTTAVAPRTIQTSGASARLVNSQRSRCSDPSRCPDNRNQMCQSPRPQQLQPWGRQRGTCGSRRQPACRRACFTHTCIHAQRSAVLQHKC